MPNATATITETSTATSVSTSNHVVIQQLPAPTIFGLPPELFVIFAGIIAVMVYAYFKLQVKGIPVQLLYIRKNFSALMLRASEDLEGIFLNVRDFKGKKIETLIKNGIPLEVRMVTPKAKVFVVPRGKRGATLDDDTLASITEKGYKVKEDRENDRGARKGYVLERPEGKEDTIAYIDAALGGQKMLRLFSTVEGTGTTLDIRGIVEGSKAAATGNTAIIHEERSATKEFLALLAAALRGTFSALLIPLIAGVSIGGMVTILLIIFTGHFR